MFTQEQLSIANRRHEIPHYLKRFNKTELGIAIKINVCLVL